MYKDKKIIYIKALTPIHAGAGQTLESVDMPIQREKHSNIPIIEASSLKGSIKHWIYNKFDYEKRQNKKQNIDEKMKRLYTIFGPEEGDSYSSAISFTDAKLLFFPIKSATNIFRLITCPYVIKRWLEDLKIQGKCSEQDLNNLDVSEGKCIPINEEEKVILEEYIFEKENNVEENIKESLEKIFENIKNLDKNRIVILNDSEFIDLVSMYTEIITRNKISVETGAAEGTGLFTEEYLPTETILYFTVLSSPSFNKERNISSEQVLKFFDDNVDEVFQVGGDATIGKGFVKRLGKVGDGIEQSQEH